MPGTAVTQRKAARIRILKHYGMFRNALQKRADKKDRGR